MCDTLRNTRSRGRSGVPLIRLRWRSEIRFRRSFVVFIFIVSYQLPAASYRLPASCLPLPAATRWKPEAGSRKLLGSRLASLFLQDLSCVPHALLLVGVRLAHRADVRRHLADELPIDAGHGQVRLLVDGDVD